MKMHLKISSAQWRPFCPGGDESNEATTNQTKTQQTIERVHYSSYLLCIIQYLKLNSGLFHDDVIKWKHFPRYWPFVRGIHRSPANSPHKGQWRGALIFSSICVWINGFVNSREAGDLRRYRAHYDVTVMYLLCVCGGRGRNLHQNGVKVDNIIQTNYNPYCWMINSRHAD